MKRKVLRAGNASLAVSLPSKWVKEHSLQSGDEIELIEREADLLLIARQRPIEGEIQIAINEGTISYTRSIISNAYKKGYDTLQVSFEQPSTMLKIQQVVDGLIGFEIVEQHAKGCTIKNVAQALETESDIFLKKSFYMTMQLGDMCAEDAKAKKFPRLAEAVQLNDSITKYTNFVKRIIAKSKRAERTSIFHYLLVWSLEKVANEYLYIYRCLSKQAPQPLAAGTIEYLSRCNALLRLFFEGFYERSNRKIEQVTSHKDQYIYDDLPEEMRRAKAHDAIVIHHCANIVRRIYDMTGPYFGITL